MIGRICGTRCLKRRSDVCVCGGVEFTPDNFVYCCSQNQCVKENDRKIICSEGKILQFHKKCGKQCPIGEVDKKIVSKQCLDEEPCPSGKDFSLVCNQNDFSPLPGWLKCPKNAFSKFDMNQFYQYER